MSARRKKGAPMKYRGFYCPDELWAEMQRCAEKLDISDSDFIRQAIKEKIENLIEEKYRGKTSEEIIDIYLSEHGTKPVETLKAKTQVQMICDLCNKVVEPLDAHMGTISGKLCTTHTECWNKHFAKEITAEKKSKQMVKPLPKGK